jgi:ferredoxin-type protein NapF
MDSQVNLQRRNLLRGRKVDTPPAVRLPWTLSEQVFTDKCTRCSDCINVCEENIIIKGSNGYPEIDFNLGECTFCQACVDTCQQPLFIEDKNEKPWDLAISLKDNCFTKSGVFCQSCRDVCDQRAINFTYTNSAIPEPSLDADLCVGCGACVSTCPQQSITLSAAL